MDTLCPRNLSQRPATQGRTYNLWSELSRYPATLFLYAVGLSALKANNIELIGRLFSTPLRSGMGENEPAVATLMPMCLVDKKESLWPLFEGSRRHTPLSDWLEMLMRHRFSPNSSPDQYNDPFTQLFDEFEMIGGVSYRTLIREKREWIWVPFGCWGWTRSVKEGILEKLSADIAKNGNQSKLLRLGIFSNGETEATDVIKEVLEFCRKLQLW